MSVFFTADAFKHIQTDTMIDLSGAALQAAQVALAGMLDDIVAVCEQHGIRYTLVGGTCLGALRHQGFIPWDDDVDICMTRAEYTRFIPLFREAFSHRYWVHTPEDTDDYALLMAKIRKKGTVAKTRDDFHNAQCGLCVDVFVIENTFQSPILRGLHGFGSMGLGFALSCRKFWRDRNDLLALAKASNSMEQLRKAFFLKFAIGCLLSFGSINFWTRLANRWNAICKNDASEWVVVCAGRAHFWGETYRREDFAASRPAMFAGRTFQIPKEAEAYMQHLYGDWQTIPPEEKREKHFYFDFHL